MDAGMSAMTSSRGQMRRDLLQSDVGNIDVSQEIPRGPPQPRQPYPRMQNRMPQQQPYSGGPWPEETERRAYSLNQKSLSSFFRHKGPKMHHGRSKGGFGGKEEDEEVIVDDSMSMMTYNDIRTSGNKGGERYGYGGDTAPIIPTLVTREHSNMNNVEYRKHLTAQKKSAMNAMARAQKTPNDARSMSLQGYSSVNPMRQPNQMYPGFLAPPPYAGDPSRPMMHPPAQPERGTFYGPTNHRPMPGAVGGPRAMSLMSPNVRPPNMRPGVNNFQPRPQQQAYGQPHGLSSDNLPPQPVKAAPTARDDTRGQLNVIQLSAPQQKDLREKERLLAERERELWEKERVFREQEALIRQELTQKEKKTELPKEEQASGQQRLAVDKKDIDLDPSPTLENGLRSLSVDDHSTTTKVDLHNRVSMGTFVSVFSDSPEKRRLANPSGMYQLEEKNRSMFVTAQEFPTAGQHDPTEALAEDKDASLRDDTLTEMASTERRAKRSSMIKAKEFLRKLSTSSLNKENDSQIALNKSSSRLSMNSIPNSESSHYTLVRNREGGPALGRYKNNGSEDRLAKSSEAQDDPDAFIFDNTLGKPYVPSFAEEDELLEINKFKTITISGEQLHILSENKELMSELTLVSMELAESIKRETVLEEQLKNSNEATQGENPFSLADFETELRKKSSKIVELIQQLNNERLKRFIAEEQVLLTENGAKPSSIELLQKISALNDQLALKDAEVSQLKDQLSVSK
ncbi:hypothetical protein HG536_0A03460 [Torulaspora globosa]|uniref:Uncharacterized protein n=1 Tax=Torulaspora globosa TaxID=48254 RepID=A0A7G3ZAJ2_9SACH|nr:uncharacterized protein HG536_0A03460 [Torulaspora globosa]QLL30528.1 hypothetical protein HG536_0A03460 [Torulaspora globosa]